MTNLSKKLNRLLSSSLLFGLLPVTGLFNGPFFSFPQVDFEPNFSQIETGEILVKFRSESQSSVDKLTKKHGLSLKDKHLLSVNSFYILGESNLAKKLEELRLDPDVEFAEPNYIAQAFATPNDPYLKYQWSFGSNSLEMSKVWDQATGQQVIVAVIDTGIAYENYKTFKIAPDLAQTKFVPGYNFINKTTHANDDNGHGTHVTGTVAQSTNNGLGTAGIAYNSQIMPVKVLDRNGSGTYAAISDGIVWAADKGAKILNLSLGGSSPSETLRQALAYARAKGLFIAAASGNSSANTVSYPAAYNDYVVAVGATRYDKNVVSYSNKGTALDLVAPGGDTSVDQDSNGYGDGILQQTFASKKPTSFGYYFYQGTSMATPHVAATVALLVEKGVTDPVQLQQILQNTADDLGAPGWDTTSGYGLINPLKALLSLQSPAASLSQTTNPEPPTGQVQSTNTPEDSAPKPQKSMHVADLTLGLRYSLLRVSASARVLIVDQNGKPLPNAEVSASWEGLYSASIKRHTDSSGMVEFITPTLRRNQGQLTFAISSVVRDGYEYRPRDNSSSQETVEVASRTNR